VFGRQTSQGPFQGIEQYILLCGRELLVIFNRLGDFLRTWRNACHGDAPVKIIQGSDRFFPRNSVKMQNAIGEPPKCERFCLHRLWLLLERLTQCCDPVFRSYALGWCELKRGVLTLIPHPKSSREIRRLAHPREAEIIGRVTAVAMRLAEGARKEGEPGTK
jgi:hypothetical protein